VEGLRLDRHLRRAGLRDLDGGECRDRRLAVEIVDDGADGADGADPAGSGLPRATAASRR
jgi:hypothetical protein